MRRPDEPVKLMSVDVAEKILSIRTKLEERRPMNGCEMLLSMINDMGALCIFEDFTNQDEVNGAMHILNWIETSIDN